jgi:YidC/Oxa1 family membrane protein insertase
VWSEVAPGIFETEVFDEETDTVILKVRRSFVLPEGRYDVALDQVVTNLSQVPLAVQWRQFGPGDLVLDETTYLRDVRRFHFGFLFDARRDPTQAHVSSQGMMVERNEVISMAEAFQDSAIENTLWPNETATEDDLRLSWFGATNRYFALCVHAPYDPPAQPSRRLAAVSRIEPVIGGTGEDRSLLTSLHGPEYVIEPGQNASWDMGVYAGPLQRTILRQQQPYEALHMGGLILYLMSGCCTFCTFAWLADFMIYFLAQIQGVVLDWGIAIIMLVFVVRLLLHPITRKGQVSMQRSAKAMGEMKPELDELKKRYVDDPEKIRKEQMRLMQEKGVNPLGCATGMLPMFLQMPIWIALYAVLFFAFELRQQWAFYGFFQMFDGWAFLGDLSAPDNFIDLGVNYDIMFFQFTGINLLPILMGFVFFLQQKYMTPPPSAAMSEDQLRQQKMMKVMMLVLFPIMLYGAPSGLTLYILTSSIIGTAESRYIRNHLTKMDEKPEEEGVSAKSEAKAAKKKKRQDKMGKMYEQMLENQRVRQERKKQKTKTYKKRR